MSISAPLDQPLHGGGTPTASSPPGTTGLFYGTNGLPEIVTTDVPYFAPVAINGHPYLIDLKQYQRTTLQAQRQPVDQSMEPGEQTLNTEGMWRRSQENWVLGANQYYLDNIASLYSLYERAGENQSLRFRFWLSKNVNIWTSGQMTLLPLCESKYSAAVGSLTAITVGGFLYLAEGNHVKFTNNPTATPPTWTEYDFQATGTPEPITSVTTDGSNLYATCGTNGIWKVPAGATSGAARVQLAVPPAPTVAPQGTAGTTSYFYKLVVHDGSGTVTGLEGSTTTGNATLSSTNFNKLSWVAITGAVSIDVYRGATAGAENTLVTTGLAGTTTTYNDQGGGSAGTPPTTNTTGISPDFIVYGNGRLVSGSGPTLQEVNHDGTVTFIGAHANPSWLWTAGCSAAGAIYVSGSAGHVGEIYAVSVASGGTNLTPPVLAAPLPPGELPRAMVFTGGYLGIGTSVGFRIANISASTSNGLTFGPVIVIPGGVSCVAAWEDFVYFGWSKFVCAEPLDPTTAIQSSGLGRADLGRFTSALVPAYTTDLQFDDSASGSADWTVNSVAVVNGSPFYTATNGVVTTSMCGGPHATKYAVSGMFQSGWTRYNTVEPKNVASIDYHHDALAGGTIGAFLILENDAVVELPVSKTLGTLGPPQPFATNYQAGEAFQTQVYLTSDATQLISPLLRRYTVRALITPRRMDEIILPIIMKTRVLGIQGEGTVFWQDILGEYQFLQDLCNRGVISSYQEGSQTYNCYIDRVQVKPEKWNDDRSFFEGTLICRLLTIPAD